MMLRGTTCNTTVVATRTREYNKALKSRQCRFFDKVSICGAGSSRIKYSPRDVLNNVVTVAAGEAKKQGSDEMVAADRAMIIGSMEPDGFSYKQKFIVRCYEVGVNKTATIETIANLLQEVAGNHAQGLGYSTDGFATTTTMRKLNLIWVTARMHIEILKYPAWGDVVEIETWCQGEGRIGIRRDWILKDYTNGQVIGRATSKWFTMNQHTRRLQKADTIVLAEVLDYCSKTPRLSFPEENSSSVKKIAKLEDPAKYSRLGLVPRRCDLDMNQHVNNVAYIGWALESIPQEVIDTHELETLTLDYRRECQHNDVVDSLTSPESQEVDDHCSIAELKGSSKNGPNGTTTTTTSSSSSSSINGGKDYRYFLHLVRTSSEGLEINRGRTEWRKKKADKKKSS